MRKLFLFFICCFEFQQQALAQSSTRPLILSAGTSPQAYQQFINQHANMISLADYFATIQPRKDEKVYALADHLEDPADQLLGEIQNIYKETTLTEDALIFLRDLLDKAGSKTLTSSQRKIWQTLSCFNDNLLAPDENSACKTEKTKLTDLQKLFPWAEAIRIENRFIRLQASGEIALLPTAAYHFQILSNTHKTVLFNGTLNQLKQQSFQPEPWISGNCDEFTSTVDDFTLHEQALVFFNDSCLQPLKNPTQKSSAKRWMIENKNWLYAGGAFVLGAVVYGMRNKKLVIDSSGFQ